MRREASNDNAGAAVRDSILDRDRAFDYGQEAARQGALTSECPFDEDDAEQFGAWMDGFHSVAGIISEEDDDL